MQLVPDPQPSDGPAGPRRRMTHEERRDAILTAARREFSRSGFHGASTACIARSACCSEPMLYKHFASKQTLFAATLEHVNRVMGDSIDVILEAPGDPLDAWQRFLPVAMTSELYAEMVAMRKLAVTVADEPSVQEELRRSDELLHERVRRLVQRCIDLGSVHPEVDPEYVAWMWLGITLVGSYRQTVEGPGGFAGMLPVAQRFMDSLRA
jgi:AcrR family transcriptional regulator